LCELMDTATNQDVTGNLAGAEDELKNGESYGVEEFTYDRDNIHTWIGIEPRRGNRLTFYSGLDTICLKAVGTLRLASLSNTNNAARVATIIKRVNKK